MKAYIFFFSFVQPGTLVHVLGAHCSLLPKVVFKNQPIFKYQTSFEPLHIYGTWTVSKISNDSGMLEYRSEWVLVLEANIIPDIYQVLMRKWFNGCREVEHLLNWGCEFVKIGLLHGLWNAFSQIYFSVSNITVCHLKKTTTPRSSFFTPAFRSIYISMK